VLQSKWLGVARAIEGGVYSLQNAIRILPEIIIPEANHAIPFGFGPACPSIIFRSTGIDIVPGAVKLDHQACCHAGEINHIGADRNLTTEM
jgi:hypothetical protein